MFGITSGISLRSSYRGAALRGHVGLEDGEGTFRGRALHDAFKLSNVTDRRQTRPPHVNHRRKLDGKIRAKTQFDFLCSQHVGRAAAFLGRKTEVLSDIGLPPPEPAGCSLAAAVSERGSVPRAPETRRRR